jgi:anti-anti-sigma factor
MAAIELTAVTDEHRAGAAPRRDGGCRVVWLRGEHDVSTSVADSETLARAIALDDSDLLVDLSEVRFMDASTIRTLVMAQIVLARRSRSLALRSPSPSAALVLRLTGLDALVDARPIPADHSGNDISAVR